MGIVDDILKALDRVPVWKRVQELPSEVDDLKGRIAALEEKLSGKWPADVCRFCGARAARLAGAPRGSEEKWFCEECNQTDFRRRA